MFNVLIAVRDHRTAPVPAATPHNVDGLSAERVCGPHHGANIEIVVPVFNRNMKVVEPSIKFCDDRFKLRVAKLIDDVAPVPHRSQFGVTMLARWLRYLLRSDAPFGHRRTTLPGTTFRP